ncbi:DUF397 domain-containing protein [Streptomyces sp. RFCAC02]|uniref:DUF397 domain-containing protein n=1 Tax=Streptomyces sp. RFCAC02 TaxID=2499143 RepID=UPI00101F6B19|nr:DUF397 domain-containing protein [Streptomyces sp. RFCAC02]
MTDAHGANDLSWRSSSYSSGNGGNCVQVADAVVGAVPVRDSKCASGPVVFVTTPAWRAFVGALGLPLGRYGKGTGTR